jgi:lipopolysaccharide biosynthesis regulator YciM
MRATAEVDRQSRQASESRVATRKHAQGAAETRADAILAPDAQLLQELGRHAEALQHCYEQLLQPKNNLVYLQTLVDHEKDSTLVANRTATIHRTVDGGRSWLPRHQMQPAFLAGISKHQSSGMKIPRM